MTTTKYEVIDQMFAAVLSQNKDLRRDMKRTAEKLAKDHPNSESIKQGFTIALMA